MADLKESRLAVRLALSDEELIRSAADERGQTVTEFTVQAAVERAKDVLSARRLFRLTDQAWAQFEVMLDRPVRENLELRRLLGAPSVFDD